MILCAYSSIVVRSFCLVQNDLLQSRREAMMQKTLIAVYAEACLIDVGRHVSDFFVRQDDYFTFRIKVAVPSGECNALGG